MGYAFVSFMCRADAEKAIAAVNGKVRPFLQLLNVRTVQQALG
jgi:RNA recognition motif. (a.k.a. RRM, RBD, or RNP domain)